MAIHKYGETTLGYERLTHVELARMFDTTPHRISALQKWPLPDQDARILALMILLRESA
jgi:hypothetical protein